MRASVPAAALLLLLLLPGCLTYEQEARLHEDGSGSMEIHYWIKEQVYLWMDNGSLAFNEDSVRLQYAAEGVEVTQAETWTDAADSTRHVKASLNFDDLQALSRARGFRDVVFRWQSEGDVYRFVQKMSPTMTSSEDLLAGYTFTYTWEFPGTVRESNADTVHANRATWIIPLSGFNKDITLTALVENSSGSRVDWVLSVLLVVLILTFIFRFLRRRRSP